MTVWRAALLMNLSFAIALGIGYGAWGRRLATVQGEVETAEAGADTLTRERDACFAGGRVGEQLWEGRGIVRAVYPKMLVVTHEDIAGLLPARTTSFRLADSIDRARAQVGDPIRFWLMGASYNDNTLVKMEPW